jgi:hypothetical protein
MTEAGAHALDAWHDWYLLCGTAAATLVGLMFVVVSLAPKVIAQEAEAGVRSFLTPIVSFFTTVLLVSIIMLVPGIAPSLTATALLATGLCGICYLTSVRVHQQWRTNQLDMQDWFWYVGLPFVSYAAMLAASVAVFRHAPAGLSIAAASVLLLLIIGIRNAWDIVIYMTQQITKT